MIQFSRNFRDNPDTALPGKLAAAEIEGIATWALVGLKRLRENGFTVPESSRLALQEWEQDTNPIVSWMQECLDPGPNLIAGKMELYDCWSKWARETHRSMWTKAILERRLCAANTSLRDVGAGIKGVGVNVYAGRRFLSAHEPHSEPYNDGSGQAVDNAKALRPKDVPNIVRFRRL